MSNLSADQRAHVWQEMTDCCINPQCRANRNSQSADEPCPCAWSWPTQEPRPIEERTSRAIADAALAKIIRDIRSRSGLENAWDEIDVDIRNEIISTWRGFIVTEIQAGAL